MDKEHLIEAARTGNVTVLYKLLQENPLIFTDAALSSPHESILHIATKAGQLNFVRELIKHNSEAAIELNEDGFRPMDIASAMGKVEIVKELLMVGSEICRLKGKDRRTALHYAAVKGRVEVIDELLSACPEAIEDVTTWSETALHLAVKNYQFDAFGALVKWLDRLSLGHIINWGDGDGNTVLHLAAARKQVESIELLLGESNAISGTVDVNATNPKGLTAMDTLDIVIESPIDVRLREILRRAGTVGGAQDVRVVIPPATSPQQDGAARTTPTTSSQVDQQQKLQSEDSFEYFKFRKSRDSASNARDALLVVAALIATVTFQAGVNPPTIILEARRNQTSRSHMLSALFSFSNTLGLSTSISMIQCLTRGFPFRREILASIYALMFTYGVSIAGLITFTMLPLLVIASFLPVPLRWLLPSGIKA